MSNAPVVSPASAGRAIELALQWTSPYRWQSLARESADLTRVRQELRDNAEVVRSLLGYEYLPPTDDDPDAPYRRLRELKAAVDADPWHCHLQEDVKGIERRLLALVGELSELRGLVEALAPDLLQHMPVSPSAPKSEEHAKGMSALHGLLLARHRRGELSATGTGENDAPRPDLTPPKPHAGPFAGLLAAANKLGLKMNEKSIVEELCKRDGRTPLADLASNCEWPVPYDGAWNAACGRLNRKLKKHGWKLHRDDNDAVAEALKSSARK